MIAHACDGDAVMTRSGLTARTHEASQLFRVPAPSNRGRNHPARALLRLLLIIGLLGYVGSAQALGRFSWCALVADMLHSVCSSTVVFYSYEESLLAVRASLWGGVPVWKDVEPFGDTRLVVNPYFPKDRYAWFQADQPPMVDASIDTLCSAIIAACPGCTYTGDYMPYMPATYNDIWVCGYIPPFSSHKQWAGGPQPHCAEPGFG